MTPLCMWREIMPRYIRRGMREVYIVNCRSCMCVVLCSSFKIGFGLQSKMCKWGTQTQESITWQSVSKFKIVLEVALVRIDLHLTSLHHFHHHSYPTQPLCDVGLGLHLSTRGLMALASN
ncbi:hypothetical protein BDR04DRAFT_113040 [Suillus decipiens]|nr:hypothetical protein BDR04DRAFT_113040 [Suillus decipiens]